jgi:signal transduction histidine kinase
VSTIAGAPATAPVPRRVLRGVPATAVYLAPPAVAAICAVLVLTSSAAPAPGGQAILAAVIVLLGLVAGALAGGAVSAAERRTVLRAHEERIGNLDHDLRAPLTIIRGEIELVLGQDEVPLAERQRSCAAVIEEVERLEARLRREDRR